MEKATGFAKLFEPKYGIPAEQQEFSNADLRKLIVPIIIEQFLAMLVGLANTLMISYAGKAAPMLHRLKVMNEAMVRKMTD